MADQPPEPLIERLQRARHADEHGDDRRWERVSHGHRDPTPAPGPLVTLAELSERGR